MYALLRTYCIRIDGARSNDDDNNIPCLSLILCSEKNVIVNKFAIKTDLHSFYHHQSHLKINLVIQQSKYK